MPAHSMQLHGDWESGHDALMHRYLWHWLRMAFRHSVDITQYVLFVLFLAAGLVTALAPPNLRPLIPDVTAWEVAVYVLGAIIAVRLLLAPYWLWKEQKERADALQDKLSQLDGNDESGRRARENLEVFTRAAFDRVYALAAASALAVHLKKDWSCVPSGGVPTEQEFRRMLGRKPSSVIGRAVTLVEAQERFLTLLEEYDGFAGSMHTGPLMGTPPVETFPEYRAWRAEDPAFADAIRELATKPGYAVLHDEVSQDWGKALRERWPAV